MIDPENGLTMTEIADGVTLEDVVNSTGCQFKVFQYSTDIAQQ